MFDVGWTEMAVVAIVTLVVLGPKEIPHALKTMSHWMRAARKLAGEFQSGVNEIVREAELDDARQQLQSIAKGTAGGVTKASIEKKIEQTIDPKGEIRSAVTAAKAEATELKAPELKAPRIETAEIKAPEIKAPEIEAPEIEAPRTPEPKSGEPATPAATAETDKVQSS